VPEGAGLYKTETAVLTMSEQPDAQKDLSPEIREFLIDKLA
jgi:hypothetical protein